MTSLDEFISSADKLADGLESACQDIESEWGPDSASDLRDLLKSYRAARGLVGPIEA